MSANIQVSAYRMVPPFAQGFVRDLRVRWALEEAGLPYEAVLIDHQARNAPAYRQWQPFGQVPAYRDKDVELFESGAAVLHIARKSAALSPQDEAGLARTTAWVIAALNSIEPWSLTYVHLKDARPHVAPVLKARLGQLSDWLGDKEYLEGGRFCAGDLIMATVLREIAHGNADVTAPWPNLNAYRERCLARPAFGRALEAQLKVFRDNAPPAQTANA
jgi:glutathione S-transferase